MMGGINSLVRMISDSAYNLYFYCTSQFQIVTRILPANRYLCFLDRIELNYI